MNTIAVGDFIIEITKHSTLDWRWVIYDANYRDWRGQGSEGYRSEDGLIYPGYKNGLMIFWKWLAIYKAKKVCRREVEKRMGLHPQVERYYYKIERLSDEETDSDR